MRVLNFGQRGHAREMGRPVRDSGADARARPEKALPRRLEFPERVHDEFRNRNVHVSAGLLRVEPQQISLVHSGVSWCHAYR